jgi:hypothetical protein
MECKRRVVLWEGGVVSSSLNALRCLRYREGASIYDFFFLKNKNLAKIKPHVIVWESRQEDI